MMVRLFAVLVILAVLPLDVAAQNGLTKRYFQYNYPQALRLSGKELSLLTKGKWYSVEILHIRRGDTTRFRYSRTLEFRKDGTYSDDRTEGTWETKYKRTVVLKPPVTRVRPNFRLDGIFSVTVITDSSLVLEEAFTSSYDMKQVHTFARETGPVPLTHSVTVGTPFLKRQILSQKALDSIATLPAAALFISNLTVMGGHVQIRTSDSLYQVPWRNVGDAHVKVFRAGEVPGALALNAPRFTPGIDEVRKCDTLFSDYLLREKGFDTRFTIVHYYRQYVGYYSPSGEKVLLLNAWCGFVPGWEQAIVRQHSVYCYHFHVHINIDTSRILSFYSR